MFFIFVENDRITSWTDQKNTAPLPDGAILVEDEGARRFIKDNDLELVVYLSSGEVVLDTERAIAAKARELVAAIKQAATQTIDAAYPLYKQLNLQADNSYAQNAIAGLTGLTGDEVMQRAVSKVGLTDDPAALKAIRDQVQELDLADIMADIPDRLALAFPPAQVQTLAGLIDGYFRTLVVCICGYRLIRLVRTWSNTKEAELAAITELAGLETFDPAAGCPAIA
jgi:hypothetical protein